MDQLSCPPKIPTLHVADIELPREVEGLYDLAYNLWWTWSLEAIELFASIDPEAWGLYRNPVQMLINVEPRHWYPLLENEIFRTRYREVTQDLERYLSDPDTWFARHHGNYHGGPFAYFSMEYGLDQALAIYSGGLGVLSGDHCKSASDLGLPFVAVGLLYRHGYFQQTIDADGVQQHIYPEYDFARLPLRPAATATGREMLVSVAFPGREVSVRVWLAQVGRVPLLLLDTDIPQNHPSDRPITSMLYVRGREMRLAQEVLLGIGGVRALRAVGFDPAIWHVNEGHSIFLQLERWRTLVRSGVSLAEAREKVKRTTAFTTHTPVPAGNEQFDVPLVRKYLESWCDEVGMRLDELLALGAAHDGDPSFNLTALAIRTSARVNAVSQLNAEVTDGMWRHLFPSVPEGEPAIRPITNGVHTATWMGPEIRRLMRRRLGHDWESLLLAPEGWEKVYEIPDEELWEAHLTQKERFGRFAGARLREQRARHGASPDELRAVGGLLNPRALTIGFARRFATYKRANLIFSDVERLTRLLSHADRPVQLIFAGKAHPADRPGQELIQRIFQLGLSEQLAGKVFFLENYDMRMGRMLVQGVDVWLNNPRPPLEASGTSGQKAALNGALNFSVLDGWWPEGWNGKNGWAIGNGHRFESEEEQDRHDGAALHQTLENEVLPLYYERDEKGIPRGWVAMMKESIVTLTWKFSANRMVRDYVEAAYLPLAVEEEVASAVG